MKTVPDLSIEGIEQPEVWLFTLDDKHFVVIPGTHDETRAEATRRYGDRWVFQYGASLRADLEFDGLTEVTDEQAAALVAEPRAESDDEGESFAPTFDEPVEPTVEEEFGGRMDAADRAARDEDRASIPPAPADRRAAYDLVHAGIVAGLPIPHQTNLAHDHLWLYVADRGGVDQWAAHLGLPAPVSAGSVYMTGLHPASRLPSWLANVSTALAPVESRTEPTR